MKLRRAIPGENLVLPTSAQALCAGFPSPADDYVETLDLSRILISNPPATFVWRVEGQSLIDRGIFPDDYVIVDRSLTPRHDDVVVAMIDGERSLKVINLRGQAPRLQFANRNMPEFAVSESAAVEIWGVVTWGLRRLRPQGAR